MSRRIVVSGAEITLFHVALRELGDATQAVRLAEVNGWPDPWLSGLMAITVPTVAGPDTGGLPE